MTLRDLSPAPLAALRARIATLEGVGPDAAAGVQSFGDAALDGALPWGGLPRGALHEIMAGDGAEHDGAATGFAAALLGRLARDRGAVLWITPRRDVYAPGLAALGLDPARLVLAHARRDAEILWAAEDGLRCRELAAVLVEVRRADFAASRRLQLAAASSGVTALLLRPAPATLPASAAVTRWRISAAPAGPETPAASVGPARWRCELLRGRGARPAEWLMEVENETSAFLVVAAPGDRPRRQDAA